MVMQWEGKSQANWLCSGSQKEILLSQKLGDMFPELNELLQADKMHSFIVVVLVAG